MQNNLTSHITDLEGQISRLKDSGKEMEKLRKDNEKMAGFIAELQKGKQSQLVELQDKNTKLQEAFEAVCQQGEARETTIQELTERIGELEKINQDQKQEMEEFYEKESTLTEEALKHKEKLADSVKQSKVLQDELNTLKKQSGKLKEEHERELKEKLHKIELLEKTAGLQSEGLQAEIMRIQGEKEDLEREMQQLIDRNNELEQEYTELQGKLTGFTTSKSEQEQTIEQLRAELQQVQLDSSKRIQELEGSNAELTARINELAASILSTEELAQKYLSDKNEADSEWNNQVNGLEAKIQHLNEHIETIEAASREKDSKIELFEKKTSNQLAGLENEYLDMKKKNEELIKELDKWKVSHEEIENDSNRLGQELQELTDKNRELEGKNQQLQQACEEATGFLVTKEETIVQIQRESDEKIKTLEDYIDQLKTNLNNAELRYRDQTQTLDELRKSKQTLENELRQVKATNEQLSHNIETLSTERDELSERLGALQETHDHLQEELSKLNVTLQERDGKIELLERKSTNQLAGLESDYLELQRVHAELTEEIAGLKRQNSDQIAEKERQLAHLNTELSTLKSQNEALHSENEKLITQSNDKDNELFKASVEIGRLREQCVSDATTLENLQTQAKNLEEQLNGARQRINTMQQEIEDKNLEMSELKTNAATLHSTLLAKESEVKKLEQSVQSPQKRAVHLEAEKTDLLQKITTLQRSLDERTREFDEVSKERNNIRQELESKIAFLAQFDQEREEWFKEKQGFVSDLAVANEENQALNEKIEELKAINDDLKGQYDALVNENDALHNLNDELKAENDAYERQMAENQSRIDNAGMEQLDLDNKIHDFMTAATTKLLEEIAKRENLLNGKIATITDSLRYVGSRAQEIKEQGGLPDQAPMASRGGEPGLPEGEEALIAKIKELSDILYERDAEIEDLNKRIAIFADNDKNIDDLVEENERLKEEIIKKAAPPKLGKGIIPSLDLEKVAREQENKNDGEATEQLRAEIDDLRRQLNVKDGEVRQLRMDVEDLTQRLRDARNLKDMSEHESGVGDADNADIEEMAKKMRMEMAQQDKDSEEERYQQEVMAPRGGPKDEDTLNLPNALSQEERIERGILEDDASSLIIERENVQVGIPGQGGKNEDLLNELVELREALNAKDEECEKLQFELKKMKIAEEQTKSELKDHQNNEEKFRSQFQLLKEEIITREDEISDLKSKLEECQTKLLNSRNAHEKEQMKKIFIRFLEALTKKLAEAKDLVGLIMNFMEADDNERTSVVEMVVQLTQKKSGWFK